MGARRGGLGRGLGALIPTAPTEGTGVTGPADVFVNGRVGTGVAVSYGELPLDAIRPNPKQPRSVFDQDALLELAASISEVGLLQPVVVRERAPGSFELVMGERRWRASQVAGLTHIPALIRSTNDDDMLRDALLENLHREQLNPLEEAAAYSQLLDEFGATHEELAERIGRSRSAVTNTIRLLNLPPAVQRRVAAGVLSAGHARALLAVQDPEQAERLAERIVAEGLSVRAVEELITVGEPASLKSRTRAPLPPSPALDELAGRLSDHFDTRVRVQMGRRRGKLVVEFGSLDDLDRILAGMVPGLRQDEAPTTGAVDV